MLLKNTTVLYAEDEIGIKQGVVDLLDLYVNRVFAASNGDEALDYYLKFNPNIIILDICMPKKNGLEVLREIRKKDINTPVIMLTAHKEEKYLLDAVELHITKYLVKPFDKKSLLSALYECLQYSSNKYGEIIKLNNDYSYDFKKSLILHNDKQVTLNKKELALFELLLKRTPTIVTNEEIEAHIWDDFDVSKDAFRSLLKDLRKKCGPNIIFNRQGIGYFIQL